MNRNLIIAFLASLALVGCGADGEPIQPKLNVGIGISKHGKLRVHSGVRLRDGPFSVGIGI